MEACNKWNQFIPGGSISWWFLLSSWNFSLRIYHMYTNHARIWHIYIAFNMKNLDWPHWPQVDEHSGPMLMKHLPVANWENNYNKIIIAFLKTC